MLFIISPIIMPILRWIISYIFPFLTEQDFSQAFDHSYNPLKSLF